MLVFPQERHQWLPSRLGSLDMAKWVRCDCDPPVDKMRNLTLRMAVSPTLRPRQAHPPTWGQLKKLNQEADKILVRMGKPKTAVTMCLAMLAVVEMSVFLQARRRNQWEQRQLN